MKIIVVNTPEGQFSIPLLKVAEDRANYYVKDKNCDEYNNEINFIMNDDYEGIDWLLDNTNWEDWKDIATKLNNIVKVLESDFWTSSDDFEIKETK